MDQRLVAFERILKIMDELREKCPWDQTAKHESRRRNLGTAVIKLSSKD